MSVRQSARPERRLRRDGRRRRGAPWAHWHLSLPHFKHPAQAVVAAFAAGVGIGTALLMLPAARVGPGGASFVEALFTATSAVCVTGLVVVDTPTYWTGFGEIVILALIQIGGFGITTAATLLGLLMARRLGVRARMTAAWESKSIGLGDIRAVLRGAIKIYLAVELVLAVVLTVRFWIGYGEGFFAALKFGVAHSISAFNNAGFVFHADGMAPFVTDAWISLAIAVGVILGGLGFPVLLQLWRTLHVPRKWTMNTRIVLAGSLVLIVSGAVFVTVTEWSNPDTLGALDRPGRLLAGFYHGVMPRSGGFATVDVGEMNSATWLGLDVLMFIGGGPASTAGGIKVTTFAVLFFIILTEMRGEAAVNVFGKRLPRSVHRQALTVALVSVAAVVVSTLALLVITPFTLDEVLFEAISAFCTVGLSTGITPLVSDPAQVLLAALMFAGRLGPITLAAALALRERKRLYELPKERPIIG